jgi:hypothetical protein
MTKDPRRRQKQLERKAARRKAKATRPARSYKIGNTLFTPDQVERAFRAPLYEGWMPENLFDVGMGNVVISRKLPTQEVAAGVFLLDTGCLGVKSAFFTIRSEALYRSVLQQMERWGDLVLTEPPCVRKLIEGAVDYARGLGFEPHEDYRVAKKIFGQIDSSGCSFDFDYGRDGKPSYLSGPDDTPLFQKRVLKTLERACGRGNFQFVTGMRSPKTTDPESLG